MTMNTPEAQPYASRSGAKLAAALDVMAVDLRDHVCADLGSNVGGFVDCLLRHGAARVYAVDTGYGALAWRLRTDPRVVVLERTNAMHVTLPEPVDLVTVDVGWTRQRHILPNAARLLRPDGRIITLIKPHYEAEPQQLRRGLLDPAAARQIINALGAHMGEFGLQLERLMDSPIRGHKGNLEFLALLRPASP